MSSDSARYDEAMNVRPKGSCKSMTGSVIDHREKYPSTCDLNTKPSEVNGRLEHCMTARRPGGAYRRSHGFKTIACSCNSHPCTCGTSEARKHVIHEDSHL